MAFIAGTPIFTDSGWKNIEDISGRDKVLVKNFLGDAELTQPYALKKIKYSGKIIKIGAKDFSFSVTPDHIVVYDRNKYAKGKNFTSSTAKDVTVHKDTRIYRKFKYMFPDEPRKEIIAVWDGFGKRHVTISHYDWYKLVGYVLMRGFIRMKPGRPMLYLFLEPGRVEEEVRILGDILDRIGVGWHVQHSELTRPKIVVSSKNMLANRLITRLGSKKRKEMFLPDKIVYNSTKELSKLLIETMIDASIKPGTGRKSFFQISSTNMAFIKSVTVLGTLAGYSVWHIFNYKAGTPSFAGITKKDGYILRIGHPTSTYAPRYIKNTEYSGYVYEIDLFEGQVYVKEGTMPVWVNPK